MATTTRSIDHVGELSTPKIQTCPISRSMLLSAFGERVVMALNVMLRVVLGGLLLWGVGGLLPLQPGLGFYGALSAAVGAIYLANLADVKGIRDTITSTVPAFLVWGILYFDVHNAALVGVTLFTHLMVTFFAGFARISGSLRDLSLWPVMFGGMAVVLADFIDRFLV